MKKRESFSLDYKKVERISRVLKVTTGLIIFKLMEI